MKPILVALILGLSSTAFAFDADESDPAQTNAGTPSVEVCTKDGGCFSNTNQV